MPQDLESQRRYSEKEMIAIFQRALERQEAAPPSNRVREESEAGFSLEELEQIAGEVGLDPHHLRAAAADLDVEQEAQERFYLLGGSTRVNLERVVEGEVSEEAWELMVAELRRSLGMGTVSASGRSREWTLSQGVGPLQVTVTSREGQTRLHLIADSVAPAGYFGPALLIWIFFAGFFGSFAPVLPWFKVLVCVGAFVGLFGLARSFAGRWCRHNQRKLRGLLDRLEALVPGSEAATPVKPRLLAEDAETEAGVQSTPTR